MKKIFIAIAFCAMSLIACNKQQIDNNVEPSSSYAVIRAIGEAYDLVGEEAVTKATINSSEQIVWASGDEIGVRLYKGSAVTGHDDGSGYDAWDATFTLDAADAGKTNGSFTCPTSTDQWLKAYAAWYPRYIDTDLTNIGGDAKLYFYLRSWYDGYTDGTSLMPMLADMSSWSESNTDISFKHVGAGVRVTLKDVPGAANQASLTVAGKNIAGWYTVEDPTTAGTAKLVAGDGTDNNTVYLKFATASAKRDMTFIFPLPTVDLSGGITIKLYYDTDHKEFWSRSASNVNVSLDRGEVLDMPDLTVNKDPEANVSLYFKAITPVTGKACFHCTALGTTWPDDDLTGYDFPSYEIIGGSKYYKVEYPASQIWDKTLTLYFINRYQWGTNGTSFTFSTKKMSYYFTATKNEDLVMLAKRPAEPKITIDGTFTDWATLTSKSTVSGSGNTTEMKAYSDGKDLFVYLKLTPATGDTYDLSSGRYFRLYFDKDNDSTGEYTDWYRKGADAIPTGIDSFLVYFNHSGSVSNADIQGIGTDYSIKVVDNSSASLEVELKVPLTVLGTITGDEINIFSLGYKGGTNSEFYGGVSGIMVPTVTP